MFPTDVTEHQPAKLPFWQTLTNTGALTDDILNHPYKGSGTEDDPFVVSWIPNDPQEPLAASSVKRWSITALVSFTVFATSIVSSAYTGGLVEVSDEFHVSQELAILGISLYVVGFAFGPLLLSPLSEVYGRRPVFVFSCMALTAFTAGAAGAQNIETLLVMRLLAGTFGCAPLAAAGGVVADIFPATSRGLASAPIAAGPFMGPTAGPVIGGFLAAAGGWRWVQGFLAVVAGVVWIAVICLLPETYAPVILRARAKELSKVTGRAYYSRLDLEKGRMTVGKALKEALSRPFVLLWEPIVFLLTIYTSIIYGTLYLFFGAFPIVFMQSRGWSESQTGLTFLGVLVGIVPATIHIVVASLKYKKKTLQYGRLPPEERLPMGFVGSLVLPASLFWFAWTCSPSVHWMVPIAAGVPFGYAMVTVFMVILNYLVDAYTVYAASVLAANCLIRSVCGAVFPVFTEVMYKNLGLNWASSVPAFLAVACMPMPFLFFKYGARIRQRSRYSAEAERILTQLLEASASATAAQTKPDGRGSMELECGDAKENMIGIELRSLSNEMGSSKSRRSKGSSKDSTRSIVRLVDQWK
ncbi:hypothetical protein FE257_006445 [Aspergillus nanangensis]|uniref:Major facilitator superfamily (MFS) profile domain-containing protein n=1 Tax=Aspergillus nanangensis TaxID=2582783 RepID=A0AAD4CXJ6_ASPNN|nr:hypothetical protein FE257_006445 [Aspergillus nanangensis]